MARRLNIWVELLKFVQRLHVDISSRVKTGPISRLDEQCEPEASPHAAITLPRIPSKDRPGRYAYIDRKREKSIGYVPYDHLSLELLVEQRDRAAGPQVYREIRHPNRGEHLRLLVLSSGCQAHGLVDDKQAILEYRLNPEMPVLIKAPLIVLRHIGY